jgi:hypothetical protein
MEAGYELRYRHGIPLAFRMGRENGGNLDCEHREILYCLVFRLHHQDNANGNAHKTDILQL